MEPVYVYNYVQLATACVECCHLFVCLLFLFLQLAILMFSHHVHVCYNVQVWYVLINLVSFRMLLMPVTNILSECIDNSE